MSNYSMEIIPKPPDGTASVLQFDKKGPYALFKGIGPDNYLCGSCDNKLCEGITRGQIIGLVLRCPQCDSFNVIRGT